MQQIPSAKRQRLTPRGPNSQPKQTPSEHHLCSQAPTQGMWGAQQEPALDNCPPGEQWAGSLPQRTVPSTDTPPSGVPSPGWEGSSFLKCPMTSFSPSGEWEKALVPIPAFRHFGRRQGTAFHTPRDADDPPHQGQFPTIYFCAFT